MRKKLLQLLACPVNKGNDFRLFAAELVRNGELLYNLDHEQLLPDDDVKNGIVISLSSKTAYPVHQFIGIFLKDADVDKGTHKTFLEPLLDADKIPSSYRAIIRETLQRIYGAAETKVGNWNRDEMRYYDKEVETEELRLNMLKSVKEYPVWRIFIPRKKEIIDKVEGESKGQWVLEIGSGNSRTVAQMFRPAEHHFNYIGTDISLKRLMVAKMAIPEGDFLQASAMNLPFAERSFKIILSFGMLHHLPNPAEAIREADEKLQAEGFLGFHEPVYTSRAPVGNKGGWMRKMLRSYTHSEHDNKIELQPTLQLLTTLHHRIINFVPYNSVFRALLESVVKKINKKGLHNKKSVVRLMAADHFLLTTVCKLSGWLGPQAVIVVTRKMA